MFKKLCLITTGATLLYLHTIGFAVQSTLNFQNRKPTTTITPGAPIAPNDFANQVKATNTQNHNQFKQQLDQQKNELSRPKIPSLSEVQNMSQTPPPPPVEAEPESTNNTITNETRPAKPSNAASPTTAPAPTTQNLEPPVLPSAPPPPAAAPTPAPMQTQPYTGFTNPSQPTRSNTPQQQQNNKNSGFNIQY